MLKREVLYFFMSTKYLSKRVNRNTEKLKAETDHNKKIKIIDDDLAILKAVGRKHRIYTGLMERIKNVLSESPVK